MIDELHYLSLLQEADKKLAEQSQEIIQLNEDKRLLHQVIKIRELENSRLHREIERLLKHGTLKRGGDEI
jgi:hypothetical protein